MIFIVFNVWTRHNFLKSFIGTKPEEDASMDSCINVTIAFSTCLLVSSVFEIGFYFLFNRKVKQVLKYKHNENTLIIIYKLFSYSFIPGLKLFKPPGRSKNRREMSRLLRIQVFTFHLEKSEKSFNCNIGQVQKQAWSWLLWGSRSRMKTSRRLRMLTRSCRLPGCLHQLLRLLRWTLLKQVTIHNHYTSGHSMDLQIVLSRYPFRIQ